MSDSKISIREKRNYAEERDQLGDELEQKLANAVELGLKKGQVKSLEDLGILSVKEFDKKTQSDWEAMALADLKNTPERG